MELSIIDDGPPLWSSLLLVLSKEFQIPIEKPKKMGANLKFWD